MERTEDVKIDENVEFSELLLGSNLLKGLQEAGYFKPSPIQLKAIPLGKYGQDLIGQAKSGTGKTCVFGVIALEFIKCNILDPQVLILVPTREIALQIQDVLVTIGKYIPDLNVHAFIGGLPISEDKKKLKNCQIAIGTPGRIKQLIEGIYLKTDRLKMFILDEADKLLDKNFSEQLNWIYTTLPVSKKMLAFSATYPNALMNLLVSYMKEPNFIILNNETPALTGIRQYFIPLKCKDKINLMKEKIEILLKILEKISFNQCIIFVNNSNLARNLVENLTDNGWVSGFIFGGQNQQERIETIEALKNFSVRVLVATDLIARGIDVQRLNLIINFDIPDDPETYFHRIGRTGRFGSYGGIITSFHDSKAKFLQKKKGVSISLATEIQQKNFENMAKLFSFSIENLDIDNDNIPIEFYESTLKEDEQDKLENFDFDRKTTLEKKKENPELKIETKFTKMGQKQKKIKKKIEENEEKYEDQNDSENETDSDDSDIYSDELDDFSNFNQTHYEEYLNNYQNRNQNNWSNSYSGYLNPYFSHQYNGLIRPQNYPQTTVYPQQNYQQQYYSRQNYPQQYYSQENYPQYNYSQQNYPQQNYSWYPYPQNFPQTNYYPQQYYSQQNFSQENYPQQNHPQNYPQQNYYPQHNHPQQIYSQLEQQMSNLHIL